MSSAVVGGSGVWIWKWAGWGVVSRAGLDAALTAFEREGRLDNFDVCAGVRSTK